MNRSWGLIMMIIVIVFFGMVTLVNADIGGAKGRECQRLFGTDYHYTSRSATDCINSKGDGKFLP